MIKFLAKKMSLPAIVLAVVGLAIQIVCDLLLPNFTALIINKGIAQGDTHYILIAGGQMLAVLAVGICGELLNVYLAATQAQKVGVALRTELYAHVLALGERQVANLGETSLITRTTNDVTQIQNALVMGLRMMIMAPLYIIGASVLAYLQQPKLTLVFLAAVPVLLIVMGIVMKQAVPLFGSMQGKIDRLNLIFREGLAGVRVIRAFGQDQRDQIRFDDANQDYTKTATKVFSLTSLMMPVLQFILNLTYIAIIWFGAVMISHQQMQVGNLVSFMVYAAILLWSFLMLSMVFVFIPRAVAATKRIKAAMDTKPAITDPKNAQPMAKTPHLEVNDVSFAYGDATAFGLRDISFTLAGGQTLAIVGDTGAGKSTLMHLLAKEFVPTKGSVALNGTNLADVKLADVVARVAIAAQKTFLFMGTVKSNLQVAKKDASEAEMWHALNLACAADFVKEHGGLDAVVEQNAANFSGGQRQRLAIARTLLKPADMYLFDDAFSALDFVTDASIRQNISNDAKLKNAMKVIVAQRLATVVNADEIIVLHAGKIVGRGTHETLLKNNQFYQEIAASQAQVGGAVTLGGVS